MPWKVMENHESLNLKKIKSLNCQQVSKSVILIQTKHLIFLLLR